MLITELSQKPVRCARSSWRSKPPRRGWNKQKRAQAFGLLRLPLEVQRMISYAVDGDGASIRVDCSTSCHVKYYRDGFQGCSLVSQRVNSPLHGATFTNLLSHTVQLSRCGFDDGCLRQCILLATHHRSFPARN